MTVLAAVPDTQAALPADDISNVEAEAILIGALMANPRTIDAVADVLRAEDFHVALHGRIFEIIVQQAALGRGTSPVAVKGHLDGDADLASLGGPSYLARLTGDVRIGLLDQREIAKQIIDLAERRRMRAGLLDAVAMCADLGAALPEIASSADAAVTARAESGLVEADAAQCVASFLAEMDCEIKGVESGTIPEMDELLGLPQPKSLTILAGRPGMGKTAVACSYSRGAADRGHGTLFITLEMSKEQLTGRLLADALFDDEARRVPYAAIQGRPSDWQRQRIIEAGQYLSSLPLNVIDTGSLTIGRLDMLVRRYKRRMAARGQSLDLVVVDYLQLLHPDTKGRSAYEAISEISKRLKGIAKDHDVAVLALAQLSRTVEQRQDKRPQLSDLRDSGQIEQDADAVMFLLREEYYLQNSEPQDDTDKHEDWERRLDRCRGVIEFILAKRRNGTTGTARGRFFAPYQAVR